MHYIYANIMLFYIKDLNNHMLVTQLCPALGDPMNCSLPGSSVHGILQAGVLKRIAILFSSGSSQPRDWTWVSCIASLLPSEPPGQPWASIAFGILDLMPRGMTVFGDRFFKEVIKVKSGH